MIEYRQVAGPALVALEERNAAKVRAVPTPFEELNRNCMGRGGQVGLAHGWHVLAAGRSGQGKTFLAANIASKAIETAEGVCFHSLEMDFDELATRIMAIAAHEPAYLLNPGRNFSREAFRRARERMDAMRGSLFVNREPMHRLEDLLAGMRRNFEEHGARLHVVDYLQLAWTGDAGSMFDRITEVSHAVRQLAKELQIVTFCLSQFNRATSSLRNERPQKEGMVGGSALENDADMVLLLDHSRRRIYRDTRGYVQGSDSWLLLDKNRHGPSGVDIPIRFAADTGIIRERLPDEIHDEEVSDAA